MHSETEIERVALGRALQRFMMDTRPHAPAYEVAILISEALTQYDALVGSGLYGAEVGRLLIKQAAWVALTGRPPQNWN